MRLQCTCCMHTNTCVHMNVCMYVCNVCIMYEKNENSTMHNKCTNLELRA